MDTRALSRSIRWRLRREVSRLGWQGLAGFVLLAGAGVFWVSASLPVREEISTLKGEHASLRARLRSAVAEPPRALSDRATQLDNFYGFFPATDTLPDWIGSFHNAAGHNGLVLDHGDYRMPPRGRDRLQRYQVSLPVRGTYPQLRGFIAETLATVPAAALEDIVMRREAIGSPVLDARLTFTLYFGDTP
ncbi:MAG: hypothetical protein WCJ69_13715 [Betaproteobacteria bacterium]|jgi:hypothetical protein